MHYVKSYAVVPTLWSGGWVAPWMLKRSMLVAPLCHTTAKRKCNLTLWQSIGTREEWHVNNTNSSQWSLNRMKKSRAGKLTYDTDTRCVKSFLSAWAKDCQGSGVWVVPLTALSPTERLVYATQFLLFLCPLLSVSAGSDDTTGMIELAMADKIWGLKKSFGCSFSLLGPFSPIIDLTGRCKFWVSCQTLLNVKNGGQGAEAKGFPKFLRWEKGEGEGPEGGTFPDHWTIEWTVWSRSCHAKSVAWTNRVISPGNYNVSNGFMLIWFFGQFRWSSCNNSLFSQTCLSHLLLGVAWAVASFSRGEGGDVKHTFMGGLGGIEPPTSSTGGANTAAAGGNASTAGRVEAEKGGRNRKPTTFKPIDNHAVPHQPRHAPPPRASHSSSSSSGGMGWQLGGRKRWGESAKWGHHAAPRHQHPGARSPEPGARRYLATPAAAVLWLRLEG